MDLSRLPNSVKDFEKLITEGRIYVDKTDLIYSLAINNSQPIFLSRPRRFGKSLLVSTFECLFKQKQELFKGLKIENLWKDQNTYKVLHLDFSSMATSSLEAFLKAFNNALDVFIHENNVELIRDPDNIPSEKFNSICDLLEKNSLVLLIDEYDSPLTSFMDDDKKFEAVRNILSDFYKAVKANSEKLRFLFITGVTRYSNTSIFSAFNDLYDISLNTNYGSLLGYTDTEIDTYFGDYLKEFALQLNTSYEDVKTNLKENYDGYCFEETASVHVYNTWSVISFINGFNKDSLPYKPYWSTSGAYSSLVMNFIKDISNLNQVKQHSFNLLQNLNSLDNGIVLRFEQLNKASNPIKMDPRVLMYQAGYLTIKESLPGGAKFGIPNLELQKYLYTNFYENELQPLLPEDSSLQQLNGLLFCSALEKHQSKNILDYFSLIIKSIAYDTTIFTHENNLREFIYLALKWLGTDVQREVICGKGRADILIKTLRSYYVFELKLAKNDEEVDSKLCEAVNQIKEKDYGNETFKKNLYRYAVVISEKAHDIAKYEELEPIEIA